MLKANILFSLTAKKLLLLDYTVSKENGVDKEDLAGCNVFFTVAIELCAAVAPACYRLLFNPFQRPCQKDCLTRSKVGIVIYQFKGTVSQDFLYPSFFTNQLLLVQLEMS